MKDKVLNKPLEARKASPLLVSISAVIMGMLAGTYTDPPALAYANQSCSKEAPAVGYSTVYPLSMFLRILTAQIIILLGCGAI